MSSARVRLPDKLETLLRGEMETAIYQANLGEFDSRVAHKYLIDQIPQIDIATEFGYERSAISKRIPRIIEKVELAAVKLNLC